MKRLLKETLKTIGVIYVGLCIGITTFLFMMLLATHYADTHKEVDRKIWRGPAYQEIDPSQVPRTQFKRLFPLVSWIT